MKCPDCGTEGVKILTCSECGAKGCGLCNFTLGTHQCDECYDDEDEVEYDEDDEID